MIEYGELIEDVLATGAFHSTESRTICRTGIANYFAGAAMLPYEQFLVRAHELRHDLDALSKQFGASVEQVAQRLSSMQRLGAKGVPFFFVRVDQAGTITKRHSATRLQFARFGGSCPLWIVHQAFEAPGRLFRQLAQTPDGVRYVCLAREVYKPPAFYRAPTGRYSIAVGCETVYGGQLVYCDDLDLQNDALFEPIGISCRICPRIDCAQRSIPPLEARLTIDETERGLLPYRIGGV